MKKKECNSHRDSEKCPPARALALAELIQYAPEAIVSRTLADSRAGTLTLFAFDAGQGLSEHSAPYDAFVQALDGEATVTIGGKKVRARAGQIVLMPANVPHALTAARRFKMLLIMFKAK